MNEREPSGKTAEEAALRESELKYRTLFEASTDAIFVETLDGMVVDCNGTACSMFGYTKDELLGLTVVDLVPPAVAGQLGALLPQLRVGGFNFEAENVRKGGETFPVEVVARLAEIDERPLAIVVVRDITKRKEDEERRKEMEARLRHQQKLESIGTLASGVAHEINNPVNIVMNYAELIARRATADPEVQEFAREIVAESERIAVIVRNLLAFSRQEREGRSMARMVDVVTGTLALVRKVLEKDQIAITVHVPEDLPLVSCRTQQIQQVLMNLLTNARDALNERFPGHDEDKVVLVTATALEGNGSPWVRLTVEDHGAGIPEDAMERIFDPFFTLKPREKGTGLGLSVSHGIVAEHDGRLTVECRRGEVTRFHVDLPAGSRSEG
jgi:PAS domain S-box-containing protein